MERIFRKYNVKVRDCAQTVRHETYEFRTVVEPEDFAIYEACLKAQYVCHQVYHALRGQWSEFTGCIAWSHRLCDPNQISLPWIRDEWGAAEAEQASRDYHECCKALSPRTGRDADTGEERSLIYGLLD
jgi:hypothetical protein